MIVVPVVSILVCINILVRMFYCFHACAKHGVCIIFQEERMIC